MTNPTFTLNAIDGTKITLMLSFDMKMNLNVL